EASERAAAAQREVGRAGDETASRHGVLSGATSKLGDAFSGVTGKAKELASAIGPAALGAGAGAAVAAIGSALVSVGSTFDDVIDTIRVGTGASGEALDGLVASAKKIGSEVPADFAAIGTTVSDLNTRLGLTGQPLETLTKQFVELGRITGEEVDINGVTAAFQAFGVQG
ncbi:phage tail tape measure protein, partial [Tsukamurella ocularis]